MKTSHIIILVAIAVAIGGLLMYSVDFSTYDSIESAKNKQGKYVHLIAKLDKNYPIEYNAIKDPNYLSFYAVDSLGSSTRVIYRNAKPAELEQSERIILMRRGILLLYNITSFYSGSRVFFTLMLFVKL